MWILRREKLSVDGMFNLASDVRYKSTTRMQYLLLQNRCQAASFPKTLEETESGRDSFSDVFFHAPSFHPAPLVNPPSYGQGTGTSSAPKSAFFAATSRGIMALPSMSKAKISTSGAACASSWAAWATRRCTSLVVWLAPKPRTSFGRETMYLYTLYLLIYT